MSVKIHTPPVRLAKLLRTPGGLPVAEITFQAIEQDRFYVFPSPEALPLVKSRMDHVLDQTNPDLPYEMVPALKARRDRLLAAITH